MPILTANQLEPMQYCFINNKLHSIVRSGLHSTKLDRVNRPLETIIHTWLLFNTGTCSVTPSSGIALSTNFTFSCEGWSDPESPLTYKFFHGNNQSKALFYYRTIASGVSISHSDWLPSGEESNNYTLPVSMEIRDAMGSSSFVQFLLRVSEDLDVFQGFREL